MQDAFEKIKERLEVVKNIAVKNTTSKNILAHIDWVEGIDKAIEIVNQVAEEYSATETIRTDRLDCEVPSDYFPNIKEVHVINEWTEEEKVFKEVAEDGWIPVSSGKLPEEKENPVTECWYVYPVMIQFDDISDIRYYSFGNGHWHYGPNIMDEYVTHWMDIKPYQTEGE